MLFCGSEILHSSPYLNLKPSLSLDFPQVGQNPEFLPQRSDNKKKILEFFLFGKNPEFLREQSDHKKTILDFFLSGKKPEILHSPPYLNHNHSTGSVTQSQGIRTSLGLQIY